ncbi:MAG: P-type conjugative transfer protein TrbG [Desulfovibrio sp.]|nr:P-type conjugative transfer protein TrbG [Desulfovibrio sp.]
MKKFAFLLLALALPVSAFAAPPLGQSAVPEGHQGYPPALPPGAAPAKPAPAPLPDYLGQDTVPLTKGEQRALRLSRAWTGRGPAPVLSFSGKLIYVHGASMPTILASPMQVCDVELQKGEKVHEIVVGDSARWMVETGSMGSGGNETVHLFIKPVDAGLETSAVVTTDRRVYHLRLVSQRSGHTPYVGFTYSDQLKIELAEKRAAEVRAAHWDSTQIDGQSVDLSNLNFAYSVKGKAAWKPERVYDNGQQTFIRLPEKAATGEMPVLLVRKGKQNIMVNYRVKDQAMVVDGLFEKISLILGVGKAQEEVIISREN